MALGTRGTATYRYNYPNLVRTQYQLISGFYYYVRTPLQTYFLMRLI